MALRLLSIRELEILKWLTEGKSTNEVAMILKLSPCKVKFYISNILKKLNAVNRTHAVAVILRQETIIVE